jgi:hypothetical protein
MYKYTYTVGGPSLATRPLRLSRLMTTFADVVIVSSPHKFIHQYARNCVYIRSMLIQHPGLKTELNLKPDESAFDIIRFLAVFSEVISIHLVLTARGQTAFGTTDEGI